MPIPAAAIAGALGIGKAVTGLLGIGSSNDEAEKLAASRPKYKISPYVNQAIDLAESELSNGMSADARTSYEQGNDRALAASVDAILKSGGSVNNIADVFDASAMGRSRLAQLQEQMRLQQVNNLRSAWANGQEEQAKAFEFNDWRKWSDAAQANAQSRQNASNNLWGGLDTIGSAATSYLGQLQQQQNYDRYFGNGAGNAQPYRPTPTYQPPTGIAYDFSNNYMVPTSAVNNGRPISF